MEVQRQFGVAATIIFTMVDAGTLDLAVTGDWTPATGDTKISKDGGNVANTTNNPAVVGGTGSVLWTLTLTAAEMAAAEIDIQIVDSATKAVEDNVIIVTTRMGGQLAANGGIQVLECDTGTFVATTTQAEFFSIAPSVTEQATASHFVGRLLLWTSGDIAGELTNITASSLANSKILLTYDTVVTTPADAVTAVIL